MIDKRTVFEIHRLENEGYTQRQIAAELRIARKTIKKYLEHPEQTVRKPALRPSKLDPYKDVIDLILEEARGLMQPSFCRSSRKRVMTARSPS